MSYFSQFERLFMERSFEIVDTYSGEYETTLLLNCLLGLLLVPKEKYLEVIPEVPFQHLHEWGLEPGCISSTGRGVDTEKLNLKEVVRRLRNAVAHCRIEPFPNDERPCEGFYFRDANGFEAMIKANDLKVFLRTLLDYLKNM